jgi:uncharacterized membrane protein
MNHWMTTCTLLCAACGNAFGQISFELIPLTPSGKGMVAAGLWNDGTIVVGVTTGDDGESIGVIWSRETGHRIIERPASWKSSAASCISDDGRVVGGSFLSGEPDEWWWQSAISVDGAVMQASMEGSSVGGLSADGDIASVTFAGGVIQYHEQAYVHHRSTKRKLVFPPPAPVTDYVDSFTSRSADLSRDGKFVVGSFFSDARNARQPVRWEIETGGPKITALPIALPLLEGLESLEPMDISDDGLRIAGIAYRASYVNVRAVLIDVNSGTVEDLGVVSPFTQARGKTISGNGWVVGGDCYFPAGDSTAFYWSRHTGLKDMRHMAIDAGFSMDGYSGMRVAGISGDGSVVAGFMRDASGVARAWIATIPPSTACPADVNESGSLDDADVTTFTEAFVNGNEEADFDDSGFVEDFFGRAGALGDVADVHLVELKASPDSVSASETAEPMPPP